MQAITENHECQYRSDALKYRELSARLSEENAMLKQRLFGKKSEKMPSVRNGTRSSSDTELTKSNRKERRSQRDNLPTSRHEHKVADEAKCCPKCGSEELKKVGEGKISTTVEYIPARLERQIHVQETLACPCGDYVVTAKGPTRPVEGGQYGPGFMANIVVSKCVDSLPLYRMEKQLSRAGLKVSRSTLCNLFHQTANVVKPIYERMLKSLPGYHMVLADETPLPIMASKKAHKGYVWAFCNNDYILYRYSRTRSGDTPDEVLNNSKGILLADAFGGYNKACSTKGRKRAGCWAHARRKFFEAKATAPESLKVLELISSLYQVEYEAKEKEVFTGAEHLELRKSKSASIIDKIKKYLVEQQSLHPPKSPFGKAIGYIFNNWQELSCFLIDAKIPLDNNASERALRIIAIGRKNYLFAGNDDAAENLAGLYSLMASCELNDINPEQYLADVLVRVHTHPQQEIDELLPHKWKKLYQK